MFYLPWVLRLSLFRFHILWPLSTLNVRITFDDNHFRNNARLSPCIGVTCFMDIFARHRRTAALLTSLAYLKKMTKKIILRVTVHCLLLIAFNTGIFRDFTASARLLLGHLTVRSRGALYHGETREFSVQLMRKIKSVVFCKTMRIPKLGKTRMKNRRCFYFVHYHLGDYFEMCCNLYCPSNMILHYSSSEFSPLHSSVCTMWSLAFPSSAPCLNAMN